MDRCPKCGDQVYGFGHSRWEELGGRGMWGEGVDSWDSEGKIKPNKYAACIVCGHKVPWKTAYGETKDHPTPRGVK